jgi:hypothetical protein
LGIVRVAAAAAAVVAAGVVILEPVSLAPPFAPEGPGAELEVTFWVAFSPPLLAGEDEAGAWFPPDPPPPESLDEPLGTAAYPAGGGSLETYVITPGSGATRPNA